MVSTRTQTAAFIADQIAVNPASTTKHSRNLTPLVTAGSHESDEVHVRNDRQESVALSMNSIEPTAVTKAQDGADGLDCWEIADKLVELDTIAYGILSQVLHPNPDQRSQYDKQFFTDDSRERRDYVELNTEFERLKPTFVTSSEYIQLDSILIALGIKNEADLSWKPDAIVYRANLCQLISDILLSDGLPSVEALEAAEVNFAKNIAACEDFIPRAFHLALDLTTHTALARLEEESKHEARPQYDKTIRSSFGNDENQYQHWGDLKLHEYTGPSSSHPQKEIQAKVSSLIKASGKNLRTKSSADVLATLRSEFAWQKFRDMLTNYALWKTRELDKQIRYAGGSEHIQQRLLEELRRTHGERHIVEEDDQSVSGWLFVTPEVDNDSNARQSSPAQDLEEEDTNEQQLFIQQPEVTKLSSTEQLARLESTGYNKSCAKVLKRKLREREAANNDQDGAARLSKRTAGHEGINKHPAQITMSMPIDVRTSQASIMPTPLEEQGLDQHIERNNSTTTAIHQPELLQPVQDSTHDMDDDHDEDRSPTWQSELDRPVVQFAIRPPRSKKAWTNKETEVLESLLVHLMPPDDSETFYVYQAIFKADTQGVLAGRTQGSVRGKLRNMKVHKLCWAYKHNLPDLHKNWDMIILSDVELKRLPDAVVAHEQARLADEQQRLTTLTPND